jgi:electron transfer flavoprotein alpha subunit
MNKTLIVVAETEHGELTLPTLECVEEAREIADGLDGVVHVILPGHNVAGLVDELAAHGADAVTIVDHPALANFSADGWLAALTPLIQQANPTLALIPDSGSARAWMPRLSARWRIPLVSGCIQVKVIADGYPELIVSHDGIRHERLVWPYAAPVGAMLIPGVRGIGAPRQGRHVEVTQHSPALDPASFRDRTLRTLPADPRTVDLTEAERIVSGGLGVGGPEGMAQLQQLADRLNAALGGTRVVADRGWLAEDRFIGTTGKIVAPKLYVAFGFSGAGQHLAGITGSELIIAINTDRTSPLLNMADLGVVGDLHEILPILLKKLEQLTSASSSADSPGSDQKRQARAL